MEPPYWPLASSSMTVIKVPGLEILINAFQTLLPVLESLLLNKAGKGP